MALLKDKSEIIAWLDTYKIEKYKLIKSKEYGYMVDVKGDVSLSKKDLHSILVKFNRISGTFDCSQNKLTILEGAPSYVKRDFNCEHNDLITLRHLPEVLENYFFCDNNPQLEELQKMSYFRHIVLLHEKHELEKRAPPYLWQSIFRE